MSDASNQPTDTDARELLTKLAELHAALPDNQQRLLDGLIAAAASTKGDEVEGFATMTEYLISPSALAAMDTPATEPSFWQTMKARAGGTPKT